ncbi:MAG: Gfo/Idh/MocA family oxidoreductase [Elusimicrobia bacterium]|nr:Gfo/Idh/MocA family oxidoreductase [Elusimicrobiota bacterium]
MRPVRVCLIGRGYWGSKLERYLRESPLFELAGVSGRAGAVEAARNPELEAVVEAVPNAARPRIVSAALTAGNAVFCEKPLCFSVEQCRNLLALSRAREAPLMVDYTHTFSRALAKARELVRSGAIGRLSGAELSVRHLGRFGGGSVYWLLGSHMLSVLDLFVPLEGLRFIRRDLVVCRGAVESGAISAEGPGFRAEISLSLNYPGKDTEVVLYGTEGSVLYRPGSSPALLVRRYRRLRWVVGDLLPGKLSRFSAAEGHNLRFALEAFARLVRRGGPSNGARALAVTKVLERLDPVS